MEYQIKNIFENIFNTKLQEKTPKRFLNAMEEMTSGYKQNSKEILEGALFETLYPNGTIQIRDIPFTSLCEHHILPFTGVCHVTYEPTTHVVGLSKIPRVVHAFSKRLQIQEKLGYEIAKCIKEVVKANKVTVEIEAKHMCMCGRGVETSSAQTNTKIELVEPVCIV